MNEHYYAVIMAGGGGTRLWPLSRQALPKQMLSLFDERSMFEISVDRLNGLFPPERIFVVTVASQAERLQALRPAIPVENFLIEPMPRGTASVVGMAAVALQQIDPQAVMAVLTADHFIANPERFHQLLLAAQDAAHAGYLVTLGIEPTGPSTGFGYIQNGAYIDRFHGLDVYRVSRFKEKPNEAQALQMLTVGGHAWNSGMFAWQVRRILEEFQVQMPVLADQLNSLAQAWNTPARQEVLQRIWPEIKAETIDYGIMEGARQVCVIPASNLGWNDIGSWDSLFEVLPGDEHGNILSPNEDHICLETQDTLVLQKQPGRLVVTIGVQDLVIVDTRDVLLVCHKDQAQRIRQVVETLKKKDSQYI